MAAQLAGGITTFVVASALSDGGEPLLPWSLALFWGAVAGIASGVLGLRRWWLPVQALAPILVFALLRADLPNWVYGLAFLGLLGTYWNAVGQGVPLYLSNPTTWRALETLLPKRSGARLIDLGSGLGGTLAHLARARPDCRFVGVETAPLVYLFARLRFALFPAVNVDLRFLSIWRADLSEFDVVYCFLSPVPMEPLFAKARREMSAGSLFVSNSFEVPDERPDEILELEDGRRTRLLIWRMPGA